MKRFRITALGAATGEDWRDTLPEAEALVAERAGVAAAGLAGLKRRISLDPVVVRVDGARWRSLTAHDYRTAAGTFRVTEMILVDESQYEDH